MYQFLNKVEIRGIVAHANVQNVSKGVCCQFAVCTNYCYNGDGGNLPIVDTTWFSVTAWGDVVSEPEKITKGIWVYATGRLRMRKFVGNEGKETEIWDIVADKVDVLGKED